MNSMLSRRPDQAIIIRDIHRLTEEGWVYCSGLTIINESIAALSVSQPDLPADQITYIDGQGSYLLPGIIDVHGDAFERHITPRAGTELPLDLAIAANDHSLIGAGITSFFYSITDGFEPGPRSRETVRELLNEIELLCPRLRCNSFIHIRHESVNTEGHEELQQWMRDRRIQLLSLNDHLPDLQNPGKVERYLAGLQRRVKMTEQESLHFLEQLQTRRLLGEQQVSELVSLAHEIGIPLASHDDATLEDVERSHQRAVSICEFPMTMVCAHEARRLGCHVVMGSPNLVRGGSHVGGVSVAEAIKNDAVDILCSDYHYPSLLRAPFLLHRNQGMPLEQAWQLVSYNPAKAVGMAHRKGLIESGYDADLLIMDALDGSPLSIRQVICNGRIALSRDR
ncbi:MAG: alpha-D-ribose 1-methylphosphonate 5-triphosphate diphosphatase [Pseudomonadales bacterium]|nr:alpha-D-ribose 1-methylphosphonate 5-triphosphate diphosphatase [Oleiphilus messinensis]MCG8611740.1 alpha-D-ribose 1-methylphosphonate 5-triphosphate diphosphatase [Pseudomonadales bacterium]